MPILLCKEEEHASGKKQKRDKAAMVAGETVAQRQGPNEKSKGDHTGFEPEIMDDIHSKNGQTGKEKR